MLCATALRVKITAYGELRKNMKAKKQFKTLSGRICTLFLAVLLLSVLFAGACSGNTDAPQEARENVSVTVFDGEHYTVKGENKRTVRRGESVAYEIVLEEGYELVSSFGAECAIPSFKENYSFTQEVEFSSVNYDTTVTFETRKLKTTDFAVVSNTKDCEVEIQIASGCFNGNKLYVDDVINLYAIPATGYRFHCWSMGNYLTAGGTYFSKENILTEFDFNTTHALFANFKSTADSARTIIYDFGEGMEFEQDCSALVAHHYLANTFTEPDLLENGYELPKDKMLVGWNTESGDYVGLGSRTAVSDETYITLTPIWKEYSPESDFEFDNGKITAYNGESTEVVIPKKIDGKEVTGISSNAFEECTAETYYLPNTVTSVEENAFLNCMALKEFYMSDNVMDISDVSFRGCKNFETLHLNAYMKPRYATIFGSLKGNIYDKIIMEKNKKKCIIIGGSSVSCAYNVELSEKLLDGKYYVYNLGYNAGMCGYAHFDIIDEYLKEGDVFIHAPEQNRNSWSGALKISVLNNEDSFCIDNLMVFEICECDWQLLSRLTINKYSQFFNWFNTFNNSRLTAPPQEYYDFHIVVPSETPGWHTITGEDILYECGKEGHVFGLNGNIQLFTDERLITLANTNIYKSLLEKGVNVCVTFAPTNRHNLYITYGNEENLKIEADKYTQTVKGLVANDVHVLLSQYDMIYNGEFFGNTDWHIAHPTRNVHTTKVINALIAELNKNGGGV